MTQSCGLQVPGKGLGKGAGSRGELTRQCTWAQTPSTCNIGPQPSKLVSERWHSTHSGGGRAAAMDESIPPLSTWQVSPRDARKGLLGGSWQGVPGCPQPKRLCTAPGGAQGPPPPGSCWGICSHRPPVPQGPSPPLRQPCCAATPRLAWPRLAARSCCLHAWRSPETQSPPQTRLCHWCHCAPSVSLGDHGVVDDAAGPRSSPSLTDTPWASKPTVQPLHPREWPWWLGLGWRPGAHPAAVSFPPQLGKGEKIRGRNPRGL